MSYCYFFSISPLLTRPFFSPERILDVGNAKRSGCMPCFSLVCVRCSVQARPGVHVCGLGSRYDSLI